MHKSKKELRKIMHGLSLDSFIPDEKDIEINQYNILSGLKNYLTEFKNKKIYPALSDLIKLYNSLDEVKKTRLNVGKTLHKEIKNFDFKTKKVQFQLVEPKSDDFMYELIDWGMPRIRDVIEEGIAIYDFVENNIAIEEIGIIPLYKEEGYLIIPNHQNSKMLVHKYDWSLFKTGKNQIRALKTKEIESYEMNRFDISPYNIRKELVLKHKELSNPATYFSSTDLDFPFEETIFPIAKRKLIKKLSL